METKECGEARSVIRARGTLRALQIRSSGATKTERTLALAMNCRSENGHNVAVMHASTSGRRLCDIPFDNNGASCGSYSLEDHVRNFDIAA